jgi:hypothetical protein
VQALSDPERKVGQFVTAIRDADFLPRAVSRSSVTVAPPHFWPITRKSTTRTAPVGAAMLDRKVVPPEGRDDQFVSRCRHRSKPKPQQTQG